VQQWSAPGQFAGSLEVTAQAVRADGWRWTWVAIGEHSLAGLVLVALLWQFLASGQPPA
jgi:hypothetical protein